MLIIVDAYDTNETSLQRQSPQGGFDAIWHQLNKTRSLTCLGEANNKLTTIIDIQKETKTGNAITINKNHHHHRNSQPMQ